MSRILGIDFGTRRVGAAVSDSRRSIASPLEVYERRDPAQDARHYRELVAEEEVTLAVIGLPVHLGGKEGASAAAARAWGDWFAGATGLEVRYYDERYTTVDAEASLVAAGTKRAKRKSLRDMLAARILLQNYLDDGCPPGLSAPAPIADEPQLPPPPPASALNSPEE